MKKTDDNEPKLPPDDAERVGLIAPIRLASLAIAAKLDAAKLRTLKLERARLVSRYGADSPEVARSEAEFDLHVAIASTRETDIQRARVPPLPTDKDHLIVHGRVIEPDGTGIAGAKVVANDESGKAAATSKTDEAGYYHLKVPAKTEGAVSLHATPAKGQAVEHPQKLDVSGGRVVIVELLGHR